MPLSSQQHTKVFISYSHKDGEWLERVRVHLKLLEQQYGLEVWDDTKIPPGALWREVIRAATGDVLAIILLVSADFLASDFITTEELPELLLAAERNEADLFTVIIGHSRFSSVPRLSRFQTVNDPKFPLEGMNKNERENVFVTLSNLVEQSQRRRLSAPVVDGGGNGVADSAARPRADCHDFEDIFDIHIRREQSQLSLARAAVVVSPLVGLALILSARLIEEFRQSTAIGATMLLTGVAAVGLSYFILKTVTDKSASIESCRFMKKRFSGCEQWGQGEFDVNLELVKELLRRALKS